MDIVANVIPVISNPLTHICNNSLKTGVFPSRMKIAKIKPIFKSGAKTDIGNYRPISLFLQFSTIVEKLFLNRLYNFINAIPVGFRKAMSTSHAVMQRTIRNTLLVYSLILKRPSIQWTTKYK